MERHGRAPAAREATPHDPAVLHELIGEVHLAPVWLVLRIVLGWLWLVAGWRALRSAPWPGNDMALGGTTVSGSEALAIALTLAGIALILGALVGPAAFIGGCLTAGLWTGAGSPFAAVHFAAVVWLILVWKTAGWIGLDRWLLPLFGLARGGALFDAEQPGKRTGHEALLHMTVRGE